MHCTTTIQLTAPNAPTIPSTRLRHPLGTGRDGTATTTTRRWYTSVCLQHQWWAAIDALGNATNLCAGTVYTITVTDANGCTGTTTIQLTTPASPTVSITSQTNVSCFGVCDGTLTVSGNGVFYLIALPSVLLEPRAYRYLYGFMCWC
ncbi:MAG: hypothetical protein IPG85_08410 [Bacteroidetes bacterium]|nr:hypothetical protein [Bacteroidota bacterium]